MTTTLPDLLADNLSVVFCGLNPGLDAAQTGHHFAGKGNRFWQVIHQAGFTPTQIEPEDDASILSFGLGLTTVVDRPTAAAIDVTQLPRAALSSLAKLLVTDPAISPSWANRLTLQSPATATSGGAAKTFG
ncbi:mismatch-specific DNA-glycosylase [Mesorhizobium sp. BR1-1-13]|uniref:mismatch-specific DNA-glycosylase n=1 Tax=Mesorhizobium sp. BR1-1-13 TaxID=2876656 RepID=UPI001CD0A65C|nr:mismatch-specific DNA-glycosylase [Mesorhizobium sp. BR1-1-13]MBZ9942274.1 mismatch-specific DNA-glycosylase [Mesorhizobium sp. BR1-1-13]